MALRGHKAKLRDDSQNSGNFLELLKFLALYDRRTKVHLEQIKRTQRSAGTKGQRMSVTRGRGAKLSFLSNRSQKNIIDIISKAIKEKLIFLSNRSQNNIIDIISKAITEKLWMT